MKDQLVFDTTDAVSIAHSDSVGAFIRSSDGTLITHTTVSGKEALDVRIAEGINVEVDLDAADDSVAAYLSDGAGTALTSTLVGADQSLDVNVANVVSTNDTALADTAIANAVLTLGVADTAQDAVASPLADRKYLFIRNQDNKKIYVGSTGVSAADGFPVSPGSVLALRAGASVDIEFVGSTGGTPEIRTLELS
jgi:hypothetical protein